MHYLGCSMRAHVVLDGVITNTIEVDSLDAMPGLIAADTGTIGDGVVDGVIVPAPAPPVPVPQSVSPRQIRQALTRAGLRASVEAAVAAGDQDTKDWYEFATAFERSNPVVAALGAALNVSDAQLDDLWILADSL